MFEPKITKSLWFAVLTKIFKKKIIKAIKNEENKDCHCDLLSFWQIFHTVRFWSVFVGHVT